MSDGESKATAKTLGSGETSALSSNDSSALQVPGLYTQGRTASTKENVVRVKVQRTRVTDQGGDSPGIIYKRAKWVQVMTGV